MHLACKTRNAPPFEEWLEERDLQTLLDALCYNAKGTILYDDFLSFALDSEESEAIIDIHEKLSKEMFQRSKMKMKDLLKLFSSSKTYVKGYVRNSEFKVIMRKISSKMSSKAIEALTAYWDQDNEGTVDFNSFAIWAHTGSVKEEVSANCVAWCGVVWHSMVWCGVVRCIFLAYTPLLSSSLCDRDKCSMGMHHPCTAETCPALHCTAL